MPDKPVVAGKTPVVEKTEPGTYWWCACGRSSKQPFCDGSHAGTGIEPKEIKIDEARNVAWCVCKHSCDGAFCDGSHSRL